MANISAQAKKQLATIDLLRSIGWGLLALYVVVLLVAQQFIVGVFVIPPEEKAQIIQQKFQENEKIVLSIREISDKKTSTEVMVGIKSLYDALGLSMPPLEVVNLNSSGDFIVREAQKKSRTSF